ncbi:MAG: lipid A biosynthesis lauroyl acyltransferase [Gammaproteobacteria bacterium]|nr:lipid A biosynthesis lauroyl acyltransferase [Gammaproteobacteria bacterium]
MRPRDLLTWTGFGLMRLLSLLPWPLRLRLGRLAGRLLYRVAPRPRHVARVNLRLVRPDLDEAGVEALLRRHFIELGIGLFELGLAWWGRAETLRGLLEVEGREHLEAAQADGRGVILLTPHFTNLELGGRLMAMLLPVVITYKPNKDPLVDRLIHANRLAHVTTSEHGVMPSHDVRGMLRVLRRGGAVWYAPDINYKGRERVFAEFFGVPAATAPHPVRIAARGAARVVPYVLLRRADGGYRLVIDPPLADFPGGDEAADTRRINAALEALVARHPEGYLWIMRRFLTRPEPDADPYRNGRL